MTDWEKLLRAFIRYSLEEEENNSLAFVSDIESAAWELKLGGLTDSEVEALVTVAHEEVEAVRSKA